MADECAAPFSAALKASAALIACAFLVWLVIMIVLCWGPGKRKGKPAIEVDKDGVVQIRSYAAVSKLPKLSCFSEDYMTILHDSLGPHDQRRSAFAASFPEFRSIVRTVICTIHQLSFRLGGSGRCGLRLLRTSVTAAADVFLAGSPRCSRS